MSEQPRTHRVDLVEFDRARAALLRQLADQSRQPEQRAAELRATADAIEATPPHAGDYVEILYARTYGALLDEQVANAQGQRAEARLSVLVNGIVAIRLDGHDLATVTPEWLRAQDADVIDFIADEIVSQWNLARLRGPFAGETTRSST